MELNMENTQMSKAFKETIDHMKYYEEVNQSLADKTVHYYNLYKKVRSWLLAEIHYSLSHWRTARREGSGCNIIIFVIFRYVNQEV